MDGLAGPLKASQAKLFEANRVLGLSATLGNLYGLKQTKEAIQLRHPHAVVETVYLPSTLLTPEALKRVQVQPLDFQEKWGANKKPPGLTKALIEAALRNLREH
ncbi:MAG: hypothetical protein VXZ35_09540 [Pseudomonadota bacterium]|nr:hypothetical protein [Pseudomonadota bacterium]